MTASTTPNPSLGPYYKSISRHALLTRDEEKELGHRVQAGDQEARARLIESNLRLVAKIAQDFAYSELPTEDLISEGNIGLMTAAERFDPENGAKFSTYAAWWIKQHMRNAIRNQVRTIRLPSHIQTRAWNLHKETARLQMDLGRDPTNDELAAALKLTREQLDLVKQSVQPITHLDATIGEAENGRTFGETIADESAVLPDEVASSHEDIHRVRQLLKDLPERDRRILNARFGIDQEDPDTLSKVGKKLGVSRERIRQRQKSALTQLRIAMEESEPLPMSA